MYKSTESKVRTSSLKNTSSSRVDLTSSKLSSRRGYSPAKSGESSAAMYDIRFKRKDLREFNPRFYVTENISEQDVVMLKQVFDYYDSTNIGVLLPNDIKVFLHENGYAATKKTIYEIIAQYDQEQTGGISFFEFMKAMQNEPFKKQNKKQIFTIFKKYDRNNKNYITVDDIKLMKKMLNEQDDEEMMKQMIEKASKNKSNQISFEEFYEVMVRMSQ